MKLLVNAVLVIAFFVYSLRDGIKKESARVLDEAMRLGTKV